MMNEVEKKLVEYRENMLRELDCIDHLLECESLRLYNKMIEFAIDKDFKYICDIGCAYGHQSELCRNRINYIGINEHKLNFYNFNENFTQYIAKRYPCSLSEDDRENTIAISILCLGWNCYNYNENNFDRQFKALSKDFKASLLYVPIEDKKVLKKYFKNVIAIEQNTENLVKTAFFYCNNEEATDDMSRL